MPASFRISVVLVAVFLHFCYPEDPSLPWKILKAFLVIFFLGYRLIEDSGGSNDSLVHLYAWWTRANPPQPEPEPDPNQERAVKELAQSTAEALEKSNESRAEKDSKEKEPAGAAPKSEGAKPANKPTPKPLQRRTPRGRDGARERGGRDGAREEL